MSDPRDEAAAWLEQAADELEQARAHCRVAAEHFRNREVPRACAHQWAARGHVLNAEALLDRQARQHAERSISATD